MAVDYISDLLTLFIDKDDSEIIALADSGDPDARYYVALAYEGTYPMEGVEVNPEKFMEILGQMAEEGYPMALNNLSYSMLESGDVDGARSTMERAATRGPCTISRRCT